jgi:outer membrane biogenesis lipoprotein LolB
MRILLSGLAILLLAGCATAPQRPAPVTPTPTPIRPIQRGDLIGLTTQELGERFGAPSFQVREGPGVKLQWASTACVLDAFLYAAPGTNVLRVAYVDARRPSGDPTERSGCISAIEAR